MRTETVTFMDYDELEEIVKKTYGAIPYEFIAAEECGNDSSHRFIVNKVEEIGQLPYAKAVGLDAALQRVVRVIDCTLLFKPVARTAL